MVVSRLHPEHSASSVPSSSRAGKPSADAMESTPGATTTTTLLRRKVSSDMKFFLWMSYCN